MKTIKTLNCIVVALASTQLAFANSVASPLDKKVAENCAVTIGTTDGEAFIGSSKGS